MYEKITGTFFTNKGTEDFIAGADVTRKWLNVYDGKALYVDGTVVDLSLL